MFRNVAMTCTITACLLSFVAGCSGLQGSAPLVGRQNASENTRQSMARGRPLVQSGCPQASELYFISDLAGNVDVFTPASLSGRPCAQITGLSEPAGIAVDMSGALYVANSLASNVLEYKPPYTRAFRTLHDAGQIPGAVVQCNGFTAVANYGTTSRGKGTVSVYAGNAVTPTRVLDDPKAVSEYAITCDGQNDVFTTYYDSNSVGHVNEFIGGMQSVKELTAISPGEAGGIDWDGGKLYVGDPLGQTITPYVPPFTSHGKVIHLSQDFGYPAAFKVLGSDNDVLVAINVDADYHGGYQVYSVDGDLDNSVHIFSIGNNLPAGAAASKQDSN